MGNQPLFQLQQSETLTAGCWVTDLQILKVQAQQQALQVRVAGRQRSPHRQGRLHVHAVRHAQHPANSPSAGVSLFMAHNIDDLCSPLHPASA